jgi:homocysteine S-methyltransferase
MIITTNTYQLSDITLALHDAWLGHHVYTPLGQYYTKEYMDKYTPMVMELFKKAIYAADMARMEYMKTAQHQYIPWIAISLGPLGAMLGDGREYTGDYTDTNLTLEQMMMFRHRQFQAAYQAVQEYGLKRYVFAWETIPSLQEAQVLASVLHQIESIWSSEKFYGWVSFTISSSIQCSDTLRACVQQLDHLTCVMAVGVNCISREMVIPFIRDLRQATKKPLVCYTNGRPWVGDDWLDEPETASIEAFVRTACDIHQLGVKIIGGCCATHPEYIRALCKALSISQR